MRRLTAVSRFSRMARNPNTDVVTFLLTDRTPDAVLPLTLFRQMDYRRFVFLQQHLDTMTYYNWTYDPNTHYLLEEPVPTNGPSCTLL